jgi:hypothetical protein
MKSVDEHIESIGAHGEDCDSHGWARHAPARHPCYGQMVGKLAVTWDLRCAKVSCGDATLGVHVAAGWLSAGPSPLRILGSNYKQSNWRDYGF